MLAISFSMGCHTMRQPRNQPFNFESIVIGGRWDEFLNGIAF